jgi:hypothetical protein
MGINMTGLSATIDSMGIDILLASLLLFVMGAISTFTVVKNRRLKKRIKVLAVSLVKVEDFIRLNKKDEKDNDVHKENFIKFLSDSRDWAYQYIEDVQSGLNKFVDSVDADIAYFDEYGDVLSVERPDYSAMKNISKAYKDLKTLLPVEEKQ